jgi:hypothetical protein
MRYLNFLFFPEGVKIDFENIKHASGVKTVKWKMAAKIRDQVFLATGILPWSNTLRIIGHTWKWRLLWGFGTILGCFFPIGGYKLRRHLATWQIALTCSYKIIFLPVRVCFHHTSAPMSQLWKISLSVALVWKFHWMTGTSCLVWLSKSDESRGIKWTVEILNHLKPDSFDGITTGEELWFHYLCESSAIFATSPGDVIPRTRKEIWMNKIMFTIFFTNWKLLIAECFPKGQKYNQCYFISDIPPELEREKRT